MAAEQQGIGMFLTDEDQVRFESYTKEQIYESYMLEYIARKKLEEEVNSMRRKLAEIRYLSR